MVHILSKETFERDDCFSVSVEDRSFRHTERISHEGQRCLVATQNRYSSRYIARRPMIEPIIPL